MGSKPKAAPAPAPQAQAVSVDDEAKRRAELERRRRSGFYSEFRKRDSSQADSPVGATGGATQTTG